MKWLRLGLQIVGAISLVLLLVMTSMVYRDATEHVDAANPKDLLFVLNSGGIPTDQNIKVVGSYRSPHSFTGDHFDSYCIQISRFEVSDLDKKEWHDGPEANPILVAALELGVNDAHGHSGCFPAFAEANSSVMKIKFPSVMLHDGFATSADIILYSSKDKMLYYVSFKT
jgi:hypothetical protein